MEHSSISTINCQINLNLTWSANCVTSKGDKARTFAITDPRLYVPVVTLSAQDNTKLLQQLKSGFKRTTNWNKYPSKTPTERSNECLLTILFINNLFDPSFPGANRLFVLSFKNNVHQTRHTGYFSPKIEIKGYNFMIDGQNFFDQPVKIDLRTYGNVGQGDDYTTVKITIGQGDDYTTVCFQDYLYFKENYKLIVIDLNKQQALKSWT